MKKFMKKAKSAVLSAKDRLSSVTKQSLGNGLNLAIDAVIIVSLVTGLGMIGYALLPSSTLTPVSRDTLSQTSVMIVRSDRRSGGSGVILASSPARSLILTNSHVCGVIENGGLVIRGSQEHAVVTYKRSSTHDLCLITVAGDFGVNTKIASKAPGLFTSANIVGHPKLLPTMVSSGHFSSHEIIEVMTGVRECTKEDIDADPDNGLLCFFLGGIPVLKRYEAQLVTAAIAPGSSGSPVFNNRGEIAGLVFAGAGDWSPAYIVPFEAVANFVLDYQQYEPEMLANNTIEMNAQALKKQQGYVESDDFRSRLSKLCTDQNASTKEAVKTICQIYQRDMLWRQ